MTPAPWERYGEPWRPVRARALMGFIGATLALLCASGCGNSSGQAAQVRVSATQRPGETNWVDVDVSGALAAQIDYYSYSVTDRVSGELVAVPLRNDLPRESFALPPGEFRVTVMAVDTGVPQTASVSQETSAEGSTDVDVSDSHSFVVSEPDCGGTGSYDSETDSITITLSSSADGADVSVCNLSQLQNAVASRGVTIDTTMWIEAWGAKYQGGSGGASTVVLNEAASEGQSISLDENVILVAGGAGGGGYGGGGGGGIADNTAGGGGGAGGSWAVQSKLEGGPSECSSNSSQGVVKIVFAF